MKVFFLYIGTPTPIFETELELIHKHEKSGDTVRVLQCTGNLPNCHWNFEHIKSQCAVCRSKFKNGLEELKLGQNVELKQFPPSQFQASDLPYIFNSVDDVKQYQYDNENIGYGVVSTLVSIFRDHRFNTRKYHNEIVRQLRTTVEVYKVLKSEIEEFRPDCVYFFNGRISTHLPAKLLCKRMGIDFFAYEVASKFNSYTLFKNVSVHEPVSTDKVNLLRSNWVKEHEKIGESFFRQKRSGSDIENLISFVKYQAKNILPKEFNRDKKNIAIFSGTIDEYAGVDGWNNIYESDETAGLQRILESFQSDSRYMFYLRVHPNMKGLPSSNSQLMDIHALSIRFSNLCVIWPEDIIDSYALMDACEKIIVFSSTMGVEATYWGKPSISAGSAFYENFNCVYRPKTHEELITLLLDNDIKPLTVDSALQYAFWQLSNGVHFEYFKKERDKNGFERITLDGVEIKADALPRLWHWIHLFPSRLKRVVLKPSLIFSKVTRIFKIKS